MAVEQLPLDLKRRGRALAKLPPPKEQHLHVAVVNALRVLGKPDWAFNHPAGGEVRDKRTAAKLKLMGVQPGRPDIELISPDGRFYGLELKRLGGRLSPEQMAFRDKARRLGWPYHVAYSLDEALNWLSEIGAIRGAIS